MGKFLHNIFILLFLRPKDINNCFIKDLIMSECPIDERLQQFADYFLKTYISKDRFYLPKLCDFVHLHPQNLHTKQIPVSHFIHIQNIVFIDIRHHFAIFYNE